ncbi:MAG: precorrin-3B C(17)-methyltransferase [Bacteroidaceae bacterium]|nr:precorrin-3B C(17)-methyltransferase [Bacteroidaceae bacterium]
MGRITVVGLGPGSPEDITPAVRKALRECAVIVGYKYYFHLIGPYLNPESACIDTGMRHERERAEEAFRQAEAGLDVCVISSGDAGIYGMAPLIWEMKRERHSEVEVEVLPGISAFQKAASLLGAPIGHDLCLISLSDLMTPWTFIEKRIQAAALGDFVTAVYNPRSHERYWQLERLREIFLRHRSPSTVVGYVRQAGREEQKTVITTLADLNTEDVDMFTIVLIGNSQSYEWEGHFITPRGYYGKDHTGSSAEERSGAAIMMESFRTILGELKQPDRPIGELWPLLHAIHTTADFTMEQILQIDEGAVETLYNMCSDGRLRHIVTDVTMVKSGIRKGALKRLGIKVHCYLDEVAPQEGLTRSQLGIRRAAEEHPDALYVFGNAPTALMELCRLIRKGEARPAGIIASPVGFVHVCESKHMVKPFHEIPKLIVEGRKGGSNLAATLTNAILTFDDAEALRPGRDV